MKHLKLIVNNDYKKKEIFFNKDELKLILNLYAKMVSRGEWKDYGLSISKKEVTFNVSHRTSESPAYKITKNFKPIDVVNLSDLLREHFIKKRYKY